MISGHRLGGMVYVLADKSSVLGVEIKSRVRFKPET